MNKNVWFQHIICIIHEIIFTTTVPERFQGWDESLIKQEQWERDETQCVKSGDTQMEMNSGVGEGSALFAALATGTQLSQSVPLQPLGICKSIQKKSCRRTEECVHKSSAGKGCDLGHPSLLRSQPCFFQHKEEAVVQQTPLFLTSFLFITSFVIQD